MIADQGGQATYLGYSMGGPVAQLLWQRHPALVDGLVLCATSRSFRGRPKDRTLLGLQNLGGKVHQVTIEPDGIDVAELKGLLEAGLRPKLAHIIPNYQNPAGVTLSLEKRQALLSLAVEYGFTIFEDDPYVDIRFRGDALPSMLSMDTEGVVVHASSFTKTVCPGVRVGYLVGPAALIDAIAKKATNLYISPGMVSEAIVHQFCVSGDIDRSVAAVVALHRRGDDPVKAFDQCFRGFRLEETFVEVEIDGDVFVIQAGPEHKLVATNKLGEPIYASPALSNGTIYIRGQRNGACRHESNLSRRH